MALWTVRGDDGILVVEGGADAYRDGLFARVWVEAVHDQILEFHGQAAFIKVAKTHHLLVEGESVVL